MFAGGVALAPPAAAVSASVQTDLQVLVLADGATPAQASAPVSAIEQRMADEGVPFTSVSLGAAGRPAINEAFLSAAGHAKYQAIVLYTSFDNTALLSADEKAAITAYETNFGIRQLDAYAYPMPSNGLTAPTYSGKLDGSNATLTAAATGGAFAGLKGPVDFDDLDTAVDETWGYLANPYSPLAAGSTFTPLLTGTAPGTTTSGTLMGVYAAGGREELVLTFPYNYYQTQFRLLASGMIEWVTGGTHLGLYRNFVGVHIDDMFSSDSRWDATQNCSPSEGDCGTYVPPATFVKEILMTPADVTYLKTWQTTNNLKLDMVYNAGMIDDAVVASKDLSAALLAVKTDLRWINHTYTHEYLGCLQNSTVTPWVCQLSNGTIQYYSKANVVAQVNNNISWATTNGVTIDPTELVSGEHSGLKTAPQMAVDNPNFVTGLTETGIKVTASDASRELAQRQIGTAITLPRYPMNVFFNTGTVVEAADEYNHMFSKEVGSICTTGCIAAPLDTATGFDTYIAPVEARNMFSRIVNNDPRPHFAHQANLTEDKLLYRVLDRVLTKVKATLSDSAPLVNQTMTQASLELTRQDSWRAISGNATAYRKDGQVVVKQGATAGWVPFSAATATQVGTATAWGEAYAGTRSAWTYLAAGATLTVDVAPNAAPTASFTASCENLLCTVDATASKDPEDAPLIYTWDFGDGTPTQAGVTTTHTYARTAAGSRTIKLTVTDPRGTQASASQVVSVIAPVNPPTASFTANCDGLACTFDASGATDNGTVVAYKWEFGDGAASDWSGSKTAGHTYAVGKTYTVKLWVKDNDGEVSDVNSKDVAITAKPNRAPTASFSATCTGDTCTFDGSASADADGNVTTYTWDFGDNSAASGAKVEHKYLTYGPFQVKLSVTDDKLASGVSVQNLTVQQPAVVKVKAVKGKGKLYVDVNPNKGKGYWTFQVQQFKAGQWSTAKKVYRTLGTKETRTINFKKGTYRVVVASKYGFAATTSAAVTLKK